MVKNSISGNTLILLTVTMKGERTSATSTRAILFAVQRTLSLLHNEQTTFKTRRPSCLRKKRIRKGNARSVGNDSSATDTGQLHLLIMSLISGVLTKADTVQRGEHASCLELVEGRRHQLAYGFFVTKQPGTEDLAKNLTFQKARSAEAKFFDRVEPWMNLAPHVKRQLGTRHLVAFLSDRLGNYIAEKYVHG